MFVTVVTQKHSPILIKHYVERQRTKIHIEVTLCTLIRISFFFSADYSKPAEMCVAVTPNTDVIQRRTARVSPGGVMRVSATFENHVHTTKITQ